MIRLLFLLLFLQKAAAQQGFNSMGARAFQTVFSPANTDVFTTIANQATLASLKNFSFGIYGEKRYMIKDMNFVQAVAGLATKSGSFNASFKYSGNWIYRESLIGLGYGRKLNEIIDAGIQLDILSVYAGNYGRAKTYSFQAGMLFHFSEFLHAGIHLDHPYASAMQEKNLGYWPPVYSFGLGYAPSDKCFLSVELQKEENKRTSLNSSIEYQLSPLLLFRAGIAAAVPFWFLGAAIIFPSYRFDIGFSVHPQLGNTPGAGLLFHTIK